jgi:hypothetical protein
MGLWPTGVGCASCAGQQEGVVGGTGGVLVRFLDSSKPGC